MKRNFRLFNLLPSLRFELFKKSVSSVFVVLSFLILASCGGDSNSGGEDDGGLDFGAPVDDSGNVFESGVENCEPSGNITISHQSIDFGLHQIDYAECQQILFSSCTRATIEVNSATNRDRDGNFIFGLLPLSGTNPADALSSLSLDSADGFQVCYSRSEIAEQHVGQINVLISADGSDYAPIVAVRGSTLGEIIAVDRPEDMQLVWEGSPLGYRADTNSFFVSVSGQVNLEEYADLLVNNQLKINDRTIILDEDGYFEVRDFIPVARDRFIIQPVNFQIKLNRNGQQQDFNLRKRLIRYGRPAGRVVIMRGSEIISSADPDELSSPSNDTNLIAGIQIDNLDVSGPRDEHPLRLKVSIKHGERATASYYVGANGEFLDAATDSQPTIDFSLDRTVSDTVGENGSCPNTFDKPASTYCFPLPLNYLVHGKNVIEVRVSSDFTEYEASPASGMRGRGDEILKSQLLFVKGAPKITVANPINGKVFDPEVSRIILNGYVQNYASTFTDPEDGEVEPFEVALNPSNYPDVLDSFEEENNVVRIRPNPVSVGGTAAVEDRDSPDFGNIVKGNFSIDLKNDPRFCYKLTQSGRCDGKLKTGAYVLNFKIRNKAGHAATKNIVFYIGKLKRDIVGTTSRGEDGIFHDVVAGQLGEVDELTHKVKGSPLVLRISAGTFLPENGIIPILENVLNENLEIDMVIHGGPKESLGYPGVSAWNEKSLSQKQDQIKKWLHSTMSARVKALFEYRKLVEPDVRYRRFVYFPRDLATGSIEDWPYNIAYDACRNPITTAFITYDLWRYIDENTANRESDRSGRIAHYDGSEHVVEVDSQRSGGTPLCGDQNGDGRYDIYDCPPLISGKWKLTLQPQDDGEVAIRACLLGTGDWYMPAGKTHPCDAEPDYSGRVEPAVFGPFYAHNIIEGGSTGTADDPEFGGLFNVAKIDITLPPEAVRVVKEVSPLTGKMANRVVIDQSFLNEVITVDSGDADADLDHDGNGIIHGRVVKIDPYLQCERKFDELYRDREGYNEHEYVADPGAGLQTPLGCSTEIYPVALDPNTISGRAAFDSLSSARLEGILMDKLAETFYNIIACADEELVDPMIGFREVYPWNPAGALSFDYGIALNDGEIEFDDRENMGQILASAKLNVPDMDIEIESTHLLARLLFQVGTTLDGMGGTIDSSHGSGSSTSVGSGVHISDGYLYTPVSLSYDSDYYTPDRDRDISTPFLQLDLSMDTINSLTHVIFKKGVGWLPDLLDDLPVIISGSHTIGINGVELGKSDICKLSDIDALLPIGVLFSELTDRIDATYAHLEIHLLEDEHLDVRLARSKMQPENPQAARLQVYLPLELSVRELIEISDDAGRNGFEIGTERLFTLGGKILINLELEYDSSNQLLKVWFRKQDQVIALSVVDPGVIITDHDKALQSLKDVVLSFVFTLFNQSFDSETGRMIEHFSIELDSLPDGITVNNVGFNEAATIDCNDAPPRYYRDVVAEDLADSLGGSLLPGGSSSGSSSSSSGGGFGGISGPSGPSDPTIPDSPLGDEEEEGSNFCGLEEEASDLAKALSDFGICRLEFGEGFPQISFDHENNRVRISTKVILDVAEDLINEVTVVGSGEGE